MTILITGITGFLGTRIAQACLNRGIFDIVGLAHSEIRDKDFIYTVSGVKTYSVDIANDSDMIDHIIKKHDVDYIIHTAAMKHIGICEDNPNKAIDVNIFGSQKLARAAINNGVKNIIAISTDKSINPSCVYGSTKFLMEKLMLEFDFSVFQGVNFFFSTGSVLDLWDSFRKDKLPIAVNTNNTIRYFVTAEDVAELLLDNLDKNGETISMNTCYRAGLHDLYAAYAEYHQYFDRKEYISISAEKLVEELPEGVEVIEATPEILKKQFKKYYGD